MEAPIRIRPFALADEPATIALWQRCGLVVPWNVPTLDIQRKLDFQPELFFVAERGSELIGTVMAGYEGHRGWINSMAVEPGLQGAGLGRRLMEHAEQRLRALGCAKINLQVRATNERVIGFYRSLGFRIDETVSMGKRLDGLETGVFPHEH